MKHLKAYTFEELLCEIPELEKYKSIDYLEGIEPGVLRPIFTHFAKYNSMKYMGMELFGNKLHFLFEKL